MPETAETTTQQVPQVDTAGVIPVVPVPDANPEKPVNVNPMRKTLSQYNKKEVVTGEKIDTSFWKDLDDRDYEEAEKLTQDLPVKRRFLEVKNDMKKNQRLASERQRALDELKSQPTSSQEDPEAVKAKEFVSEMRKDFWGALKNKGKEFELPDAEIVQEQLKKGGAVNDRLTAYQNTELKNYIQKKYGVEDGNFVYDPQEAHKAGTPSYEWRVMTEKKEREIAEEISIHEKKTVEFTEKISKQRELDTEYIKTRFHGSNEAEFTENMSKLDGMWKEFQATQDFDKNPLGLKVVYRGVFFEQLAKKIAEEAVNEVHREYEKKGLYLKGRPGVAVVATAVKGSSYASTPQEDKNVSPLRRSINRVTR